MCRTSGRIHEEISEKFPEEIKIILKHILEFSDFFFQMNYWIFGKFSEKHMNEVHREHYSDFPKYSDIPKFHLYAASLHVASYTLTHLKVTTTAVAPLPGSLRLGLKAVHSN